MPYTVHFVQPKEIRQRDQWAKLHLLDRNADMPFSFEYGDQPSEKLLSEWPSKHKNVKIDAKRRQHTITWTDASTGLEALCVAVEYSDYPVIEWTITFKNTSKRNTPIIQNIQGLDAVFVKSGESDFVQHSNKGDYYVREGYEPFQPLIRPHSAIV